MTFALGFVAGVIVSACLLIAAIVKILEDVRG